MANNTTTKRQMSEAERKRRRAAAERKRRIIRRRRRILLGSILLVLILFVLLVLKLTGAFYSKSNETTLSIQEDGSVIFEEILDTSEASYDSSELKSFVKAEIKAYNKAKDERLITLEKYKVSDDRIYLRTKYDSVSVYSDYTSYWLVDGSVDEMVENGYDFSDTFVTVTDGQKGDIADAATISATSAKALLIKENVIVKLPGTVLFVTDDSTEMIDDTTVSISQTDGNSDASNITYIIYQ